MVAALPQDTFSKFPVDLGVVVALVAIINISLFLPAGAESPLRTAFELGLVVFLPGYAVVAALFPAAGENTFSGTPKNGVAHADAGITSVERVAFSFALSIATVPLVGLALNYSPWGLSRLPLVASLSGFIVVVTGVATYRRLNVPAEDRFAVDVGRLFGAIHSGLLDNDGRIDRVLTVCLALGVVLAVTSVGYVVSVPAEGERNTEFYILTEGENGDLLADDYPTSFERGESRPLVLRVHNHEYRTTEYSVVVGLQEVRTANGSTTVVDERNLDRVRTSSLDPGETWTRELDITPTMTGERLRLVFLLYPGSAPDDPSVENAYRTVQLTVNVSTAGDATADG